MTRQYERVKVNKRAYLVCAGCRRPLEIGHNALYDVVAPGVPLVDDPRAQAQALCGPCYGVQYGEVYPGIPLPVVADGYLDMSVVAPSLVEELRAKGINVDVHSDLNLWERAVEAARSSNGGESVEHAYARLANILGVDVEILEPVALLPGEVVVTTREREEQGERAWARERWESVIATLGYETEHEEEFKRVARAIGMCTSCLEELVGVEYFEENLYRAYNRGDKVFDCEREHPDKW